MAYVQPTYNKIKTQMDDYLDSQLGVTLPPQSPLKIQSTVYSRQVYSMFGYLQYIEQQGVPFTATGLMLDAWGSLKSITRKPAAYASGYLTFTGTGTSVIPAGTIVTRPDGTQFTTNTATNINESVGITASVSGSQSNTPAGTVMTLGAAFSGVNGQATLQNAITNGSEMESDSALRDRVIEAFQQTPSGGTVQDHEKWALAAGANYAWTNPTPIAGNEVVTYIMFDRSNSYGGFPQGTNGTATAETRYLHATGDQLNIANTMYPQTPVGEISIICAPIAQPVDITITGLTNLTTTDQTNIQNSLESLIISAGTPLGSTLYLTAITGAIQSQVGSQTFTLEAPTANVTTELGYLLTLGTITYKD